MAQCKDCIFFNPSDGYCRRRSLFTPALRDAYDCDFFSDTLPEKEPLERTCKKCGRTLPIEYFHKGAHGRVYTCTDCIREAQSAHHAGGRKKGQANKPTAGKPGPKKGAKYTKMAGSAEQVQGPSRDQAGPKPAQHLFEPRDLSSWTIGELFAELDRLNAEISITISRIKK